MEYTKDDIIKMLDATITLIKYDAKLPLLQSNIGFKKTDEELEKRRALLYKDENLELLAQLMSAISSEQEQKKQELKDSQVSNEVETTTITVDVLKQTEQALCESSELTGMSLGEVIDQLVIDLIPDTPQIAAMLIMQNIAIQTQNLSNSDLRKVFTAILHFMKLGLDKKEIEEIESVFNEIKKAINEQGE